MDTPLVRSTYVGECLQYWIGEVFVIRLRDLWMIIDMGERTVKLEWLPGMSPDGIAAALNQAKCVAIRPEKWPTRRLPVFPHYAARFTARY